MGKQKERKWQKTERRKEEHEICVKIVCMRERASERARERERERERKKRGMNFEMLILGIRSYSTIKRSLISGNL